MLRPVITAADILEKRRREDGGADLLVQITLQTGEVHWLAVRRADATLTATRTVEDHGRRFVTVPARRTPKAGLADLLAEWPEILRESKADAINDHWELYRDEFDRRERGAALSANGASTSWPWSMPKTGAAGRPCALPACPAHALSPQR